MSDGLSEEAVAIEGLKFVRRRPPKNSEGYSLWIGEHCTAHSISDEDTADEQAFEIEQQVEKVFIEALLPDLMNKITREAFHILRK